LFPIINKFIGFKLYLYESVFKEKLKCGLCGL